MEEQRARGTFGGSGEAAVGDVYKELAGEVGDSELLGYEQIASHGKLQSAMVNGQRVRRGAAGSTSELVCERTPVYGFSGGSIMVPGFAGRRCGLVAVLATK